MATALRGHVRFLASHAPEGGMATALRGHVRFLTRHMPTQSGGHATRMHTRSGEHLRRSHGIHQFSYRYFGPAP
jgi:hypothetical protein